MKSLINLKEPIISPFKNDGRVFHYVHGDAMLDTDGKNLIVGSDPAVIIPLENINLVAVVKDESTEAIAGEITVFV